MEPLGTNILLVTSLSAENIMNAPGEHSILIWYKWMEVQEFFKSNKLK